jgi:UDPglucose 6-dehydrogenase
VERLSVIGLGKLGLCTASCLASKGFCVTGVDVNKASVDLVNNGKTPVCEPGLQEIMDLAKGRLAATQDYEMAMRESDITFLIVPTPSRPDGHFSDKYLIDALENLSLAFGKLNKKHHLFVITSTVSPGTTEGVLIPKIESVSGKRVNKDFGVCYNPEFIALGSVIRDFLNPDMVLIGESNPSAGDQLEDIYRKACDNKPYIARMSPVSAEIAKISLNCYITMKISFANTLSSVCQNVPGADVDAISRALGADKRVSPYYLKGGLSYGGPCFPRDNRAFAAFAENCGVDALLARATDRVNDQQMKNLAKLVLECTAQLNRRTVAVLGLSYKPKTPVIEESAAIKLVEELLGHQLRVMVYDPLAMDNARSHFGDKIFYGSSTRECFSFASTCVVTSQEDEFKLIDESYIVNDPTVVVDCWRILNPIRLSRRVRYVPVGRNGYHETHDPRALLQSVPVKVSTGDGAESVC